MKIFQALGHQDNDDTSFIMDTHTLKYVQKIGHDQREKKSLQSLFPYTSSDLIDLLHGMLLFNPHVRFTAKQCLQHKIFSSIRASKHEQPAPFKVHLELYEKGAFDYEAKQPSDAYDVKGLQNLLQTEVNDFRTKKETA